MNLHEQLERERSNPVPDLMMIRVLEQRIANGDEPTPREAKTSFWTRVKRLFT